MPLMANVDADLLKQAVLNVIQNGAQSMPEGGKLEVVLEEDRKSAILRISDEGTGHSRRDSGEDLRSLLHHQERKAAASDWP